MPRKIDAGEVLAAIGGTLVFVALFLNWFSDYTGWEAFESLDLVLAMLALFAVGAAVASIAGWADRPWSRALPWIGALLLLIVTVQLVEPPPGLFNVELDPEEGNFAASFDPVRETGAWLALAGSALVLLGGVLRLARISVTVSVGGRDVRKRVPAVDRRPNGGAAPVAPEPEPTLPTQPVPPPATEPQGLAADPQATQPFGPVEERPHG